jgi:uncharacterized membrane protein YebE (DUF533 family)
MSYGRVNAHAIYSTIGYVIAANGMNHLPQVAVAWVAVVAAAVDTRVAQVVQAAETVVGESVAGGSVGAVQRWNWKKNRLTKFVE